MKINVQDVSINPGELEKIISSLETAISRNTRVKELCEEILEVQKSSTSGLRKNGGKGKGGRRNKRPQGRKTLAETIAEVLSSNRGPLRPIELKNKILAAGYKTSAKPQSFYTAVFNTAKQLPGIVKTRDGFSMPAKKSRAKKKIRRSAG
tara:strand:- start:1002 stop:1451 length:450 start_codon:yes stop_codon:yes gene_type:complete